MSATVLWLTPRTFLRRKVAIIANMPFPKRCVRTTIGTALLRPKHLRIRSNYNLAHQRDYADRTCAVRVLNTKGQHARHDGQDGEETTREWFVKEENASKRGYQKAATTLDGSDIDWGNSGECLIERKHVDGFGDADSEEEASGFGLCKLAEDFP